MAGGPERGGIENGQGLGGAHIRGNHRPRRKRRRALAAYDHDRREVRLARRPVSAREAEHDRVLGVVAHSVAPGAVLTDSEARHVNDAVRILVEDGWGDLSPDGPAPPAVILAPGAEVRPARHPHLVERLGGL